MADGAAAAAAVEATVDSTSSKKQLSRHLHRCQNCGTIWGHGNMMVGDVEAHKCPRCGKQEWRVYSGGKSHAAQTRPQAGSRSTFWEYMEVVLPVALLAAGFCLLLTFGVEWIAKRKAAA